MYSERSGNTRSTFANVGNSFFQEGQFDGSPFERAQKQVFGNQKLEGDPIQRAQSAFQNTPQVTSVVASPFQIDSATNPITALFIQHVYNGTANLS